RRARLAAAQAPADRAARAGRTSLANQAAALGAEKAPAAAAALGKANKKTTAAGHPPGMARRFIKHDYLGTKGNRHHATEWLEHPDGDGRCDSCFCDLSCGRRNSGRGR